MIKKANVLVIDENLNEVSKLMVQLSEMGVDVQGGGDSSQLSQDLNEHFDCIIVDYDSNKIGIKDLVTRLKSLRPNATIVFLINETETKENAEKIVEDTGAYEYILKPFDGNDLMYVVNDAILNNM